MPEIPAGEDFDPIPSADAFVTATGAAIRIHGDSAHYIRQLNEQRIADLRTSGKLLRKSLDLRVLVAEVRKALEQRSDVDPERLAAWEIWALGEADKLDPILSGQIMSHFDSPLLPLEDE